MECSTIEVSSSFHGFERQKISFFSFLFFFLFSSHYVLFRPREGDAAYKLRQRMEAWYRASTEKENYIVGNTAVRAQIQ